MAEFVIENLDEVQKALVNAGDSFRKQRRSMIETALQPVATDSEGLARRRTKARGPWAEMRVGSAGATAWVAPFARGTRIQSRKRPKFSLLMLNRAMVPAVRKNESGIVRRFDQLLEKVADEFNG